MAHLLIPNSCEIVIFISANICNNSTDARTFLTFHYDITTIPSVHNGDRQGRRDLDGRILYVLVADTLCTDVVS